MIFHLIWDASRNHYTRIDHAFTQKYHKYFQSSTVNVQLFTDIIQYGTIIKTHVQSNQNSLHCPTFLLSIRCNRQIDSQATCPRYFQQVGQLIQNEQFQTTILIICGIVVIQHCTNLVDSNLACTICTTTFRYSFRSIKFAALLMRGWFVTHF